MISTYEGEVNGTISMCNSAIGPDEEDRGGFPEKVTFELRSEGGLGGQHAQRPRSRR